MGVTPAALLAPEYLENPDNWGPPMPEYRKHLENLSLDEALRVYLQIDESSPSWVSWRRPLKGTRGRASLVHNGSPALLQLMGNRNSTHHYYGGSACGRKSLKAHRVVFFLSNGYWPEVVDHIDRNTTNNAPGNLVASDPLLNSHNREEQVRGFHWNSKDRKYRVMLRQRYVGSYETELDARAAYLREFRRTYGFMPL